MSDSVGVHETVLLKEAVDLMVTNASGLYVDATFGRGGHSRAILEKLGEDGRLIAIDKDLDALTRAELEFKDDPRFEIVHGSFADIEQHLSDKGIVAVDGVLADLGVSSPQLDNADRGFSFMKDGPLDMRMNQQAGLSASEWLNGASEKEIATTLKEYGEEKFARRIASAIFEANKVGPIKTTLELAQIVSDANPSWEKHKHPATRAFQAIRIKVNNELGDLEALLDQALEVLRPGGRLVVISFHSLEDRIVKRFIRHHEKGMDLPAGLPVRDSELNKRLKSVGKAIKAQGGEVSANVRSRSAIMRVAEKLQ